MSDATENWKDVPGFEGRYRVSDLGRVYSFHSGRCLRPGRMTEGHMSVSLGARNSRCVHELVLTAFAGPRPEKHEARHLNGEPSDNRLANLEWATRGRNIQDKKWHNGGKNQKLTGEQARDLKRCLKDGEARKQIAARFSVSKSSVDAIAAGVYHRDA